MAFNDTAADAPGLGSRVGRFTFFLRRFVAMVLPFWWSERRWMARGSMLLLLLLTSAQVGVQIALNYWNARLFNAVEARALGRFFNQLAEFGLLLAASMLVFTLQIRTRRWLQYELRLWLTNTVLRRWMDHGRHYQLPFIPGSHDNPDGRIAEDIRITTESGFDLAASLFYCAMLLASFVGVLWSVSGVVHLQLGRVAVAIPGHLVWIALAYALTGTTLALRVGRPLVSASDLRQTVEADFRFGLVHAREYGEAIALIGGDADERRWLMDLLRMVRRGWGMQTAGLTRITLFTSAYSVLAGAFPILVSAPRFIMGLIPLGTMMQSAQAFQQVAAALSWPVDNLATIAQWRASVERVLALQAGLTKLDAMLAQAGPGHIVLCEDGPALRFENLRVGAPDGTHAMAPLTLTVEPGQHVLIEGDAEVTQRLAHVVAGLWPWGEGRVVMPHGGRFAFVTDRPYLPIGTLAGALCYPAQLGSSDPAAMAAALRRAGLADLVPRLNEHGTWERILPLSDQQRISLARLLLHRPDWIFLADAMSAMDEVDEREAADLLREELGHAGVLAVGHGATLNGFFQRRVHLSRHAAPDETSVDSMAAGGGI